MKKWHCQITFRIYQLKKKIAWFNGICCEILQECFFEFKTDIMKDLREFLADMDHSKIYYLLNLDELPIFVKTNNLFILFL